MTLLATTAVTKAPHNAARGRKTSIARAFVRHREENAKGGERRAFKGKVCTKR